MEIESHGYTIFMWLTVLTGHCDDLEPSVRNGQLVMVEKSI